MKAYKPRPYNRNDKEHSENWISLIGKIGYFKLEPNWSIKVIPPFGGAAARFVIQEDDTQHTVSVYLDTSQQLGYFGGEIYWEIHPDEHDDCSRFELINTSDMMAAIKASFDKRKPKSHVESD